MPSRARNNKKNRKRDKALLSQQSIGALRIIGISILFGTVLFGLALGLEEIGRSPVFQVKEIQWIGLTHLKEEEMQKQFKPVFGSNLFRLDIEAVQEALLKEPWIKTATVKKQFPDRLVIMIVERKAAAVGYKGEMTSGEMRVDLSEAPILIDPEGVILHQRAAYPIDLPHLINFKRRAYAKSLQLGRLLRDKSGAEISGAFIDLSNLDNLRVYLTEADGRGRGLLHFGKERYQERWERFLAIEEDLQERHLSHWEVDLRFAGKVVLKAPATKRSKINMKATREPNHDPVWEDSPDSVYF